MKDTLREDCDDAADCVKNCCVSGVIAPIFFVVFVLMAQFVLVNVVVAVLMKHLEESHRHMDDEEELDNEIEREIQEQQDFEESRELCQGLGYVNNRDIWRYMHPLRRVQSLPDNFIFSNENEFKRTIAFQEHPSAINRRHSEQPLAIRQYMISPKGKLRKNTTFSTPTIDED